jgi:ribosomal-protein-alanine N-acetyltransferase
LPGLLKRCIVAEPGIGTGWPIELTDGRITLRPLHRRDGRNWNAVRSANSEWLAPWEATHPEGTGRPLTFGAMVRGFDREARAGRMLPLAVHLNGQFVGQVTVSGIVWGSLRSGQIGYWIDRSVAGQGVTPTAVAMMVDHCLFGLGMHRLEVNIRPENVASLRVVEKLGFRPEGVRRRYLHIDGAWRDHATFAITPEDVPGGLLTRWHRAQRVLAAQNEERRPWPQSSVTPSRHTGEGA